jgi:four helix bundle protein
MLHCQKLDVYRRSVDFATVSADVIKSIPRGNAELRRQLRRASFSITLNIAEGAGRTNRADAARHYAIARGSATECVGVLDWLQAYEAIGDENYRRGMELLERIVAMLTKLCL